MKPIIGEVVSSTPVSLAEAASIISDFISKGTGATQEMSAYLARTRAAFDELVECHRHAKPRSGASRCENAMKEVEKQSLTDKTAPPLARSDCNGHAEPRRDGEGTPDEKSNKKKKKKHRECEVDSGALERPALSKLDATPLVYGSEDNDKAEDPEGRDSRKKNKKRRAQEGVASNKNISDVDIQKPPKKKRKKEKVVEYEVEVERNVQRY